MKTLLLSTSDVKDGAARAAYRLHRGLNKIAVDTNILSQVKYSDDSKVIGTKAVSGLGQARVGLRLTLDQLPLKLYKHRAKQRFSPNWLPDKTRSQIARLNPDIINLHWVSGGYLQIESIAKFNKPIVWTLHDMWAFTGGCHYDGECQKYITNCGACPQLGSNREGDLSRWVWQRKYKSWKDRDLTIVALSSWMRDCARSSSLFQNRRIELIPNGIDTEVYRPLNKQAAREFLRLPQDKQLILFGALQATSDDRKGFQLLQPALQRLSKLDDRDNLELVVFGANKPDSPVDFGLKTHYLGTLNDDLSLVLAYSAADAFVLPSVQDNLPNTIMEALACGTPCIGFEIGGVPDMVKHEQNGYLARPYKVADLAAGISWVLEDLTRLEKMGDRARQKAEQEFTLEVQANRYLTLFKDLVDQRRTGY